MIAKYDGGEIVLSEGFVKALNNLVREELKMMSKAPGMHKDCWTWGEAIIEDLSKADGIYFKFGGEDDRPKGLKGKSRVFIEI